MKQFVPLSDDELYAMLAASMPLVPYQTGLPCHHALHETAAPAVAPPAGEGEVQRWNSTLSPGFRPSLSAVPAASSSTYMAGALLG